MPKLVTRENFSFLVGVGVTRNKTKHQQAKAKNDKPLGLSLLAKKYNANREQWRYKKTPTIKKELTKSSAT